MVCLGLNYYLVALILCG